MKLIVVNKPMRLSDSLSLLDDMFNKLGSILVRCSHFMGEVADIMPDSGQISIEDEQQNIKTIDDKINLYNQNRIKINKMIKEFKKDEQREGKNN